MKTIRLILIAAFLTFSTAGIMTAKAGSVQGLATKNVASINISQAIHIPGLVLAMYQQLDPLFLNANKQYYTVGVYFNNRIVRISGSYDQWSLFFHNNWKIKNDYKVIERDR